MHLHRIELKANTSSWTDLEFDLQPNGLCKAVQGYAGQAAAQLIRTRLRQAVPRLRGVVAFNLAVCLLPAQVYKETCVEEVCDVHGARWRSLIDV